MIFKNVQILTKEYRVEGPMVVATKGDTIDYIGKEMPKEDYGTMIDGKNKILMPGLVNNHAHAPMTLLRGYAENLPLKDWLFTKVFPFESHIDKKAAYNGTLLAIMEMAQFGFTSFSDMYYHCDAICDAVLESGFKANISRGITHMNNESIKDLESYRETLQLIDRYHGREDGKIIVDTCIHGEYTSHPLVVKDMVDLTEAHGLRVHIHLSETKEEHDECIRRHGKTPTEYFLDLGLFNSPTVAAHCNYVTDEDIEILAAKGVAVATCPSSNAKLGQKVAPISKMLNKGVLVTLGTDGSASNNVLNGFRDLNHMAIMQKSLFEDPTLIGPEDALRIATLSGALSQGRGKTGTIEVGNKADLIMIDTSKPHFQPVFDWPTHLVYTAQGSDVCFTMVDGQVLYDHGEFKTIDQEKVYYEVNASKNQILQRLG